MVSIALYKQNHIEFSLLSHYCSPTFTPQFTDKIRFRVSLIKVVSKINRLSDTGWLQGQLKQSYLVSYLSVIWADL